MKKKYAVDYSIKVGLHSEHSGHAVVYANNASEAKAQIKSSRGGSNTTIRNVNAREYK